MSEIIVPIDSSDLKSIIPEGENIIYSNYFRCSSVYQGYSSSKITSWTTHVLFTENGVAFKKAGKKKKDPLTNEYGPWEDITGLIFRGAWGFKLQFMDFKFIPETLHGGKEFDKKCAAFLFKYTPMVIEKKEKWLEANIKNPDIKKKQKKIMKTSKESLEKSLKLLNKMKDKLT